MTLRKLVLAIGPLGAMLLAGACVGDDPGAANAGAADTGVPDGGSSDAPIATTDAAEKDAAAPRCDPTKAFGDPTLVSGLSTAGSETTARLTANELTVFFARAPDAGSKPDIYVATRPTREAGWDTASLVGGVNTTDIEIGPAVTDNGLTMFLASDAPGSRGSTDIFSTTRASLTDDFPLPTTLGALGVINTTLAEGDPYVLPDGKTIWFWATVGASDAEIFRATVGPAGFNAREAVTAVGSPNVDAYPVVTPDETTLYFASDRPDPQAKGNLDIYMAVKSSGSPNFNPPTILPALSSADADFPTWVSRDGCVLYLTRGTAGGYDIYEAHRPQ